MSTREEIEALTARFAQLVTNKDFSGIGSYYEEQARLLLPGSAMIEGRSAIQAAQQKLIESGVVALDLQAVDVIEAGDFVIEIGRITVTIKPPGLMALILFLMGKRRLVKQAKSVVVWRRQKDGSLKIAVDTFNRAATFSPLRARRRASSAWSCCDNRRRWLGVTRLRRVEAATAAARGKISFSATSADLTVRASADLLGFGTLAGTRLQIEGATPGRCGPASD